MKRDLSPKIRIGLRVTGDTVRLAFDDCGKKVARLKTRPVKKRPPKPTQ